MLEKQIEFYKEIYNTELIRKNDIDAAIGFPTTLLTLLIGAALYLFTDDKYKNSDADTQSVVIVVNILTGIFIFGLLLSIACLSRMYLNKFKKYVYLPLSSDLLNREKELEIFYTDYFKSEGSRKPKTKAKKWAEKEFRKDLLAYYVDFSSINQLINDERIKDYNRSRKMLIISILLIGIIGTLQILKN